MRVKPVEFKIGCTLLILFVGIAILSIFYTPYSPYEMRWQMKLQPPSALALFGTDNFGRDILSRTMVGIRYSLLFSMLTLTFSAIIGLGIGLLAISASKIVDQIIMRFIDVINSIPTILLALVLLSLFAKGNFSLIIAMIIVFIPPFVRMTRNEALQIRELEYIQHAKVLGASNFRIMYVHILPNLLPSIISTSIIVITASIMVESTLSYLGIGIQPPVPSLGRMMYDSQAVLLNAPWGAIMPGITLILLIASFNYLGEGIQKSY